MEYEDEMECGKDHQFIPGVFSMKMRSGRGICLHSEAGRQIGIVGC